MERAPTSRGIKGFMGVEDAIVGSVQRKSRGHSLTRLSRRTKSSLMILLILASLLRPEPSQTQHTGSENRRPCEAQAEILEPHRGRVGTTSGEHCGVPRTPQPSPRMRTTHPPPQTPAHALRNSPHESQFREVTLPKQGPEGHHEPAAPYLCAE